MKSRTFRPGFAVSALVHVGALAATLVAFSTNEKFDDLQETVPVEVITDNQFNQIMKGDKSAKEVHKDASAPEQAASAEPPPPPPPTPAAAEPTPPAPPPPPVAEQAPPPPPVPTPPQRPTPPKPVPTPPVRDAEAELPPPTPPKPVPRPVPKPPVQHVQVEKPHDIKLPQPPKPHPVEKPKPDLLAKLLNEPPPPTPEPPQEKPAPTPKPRRPQPAPPVKQAAEEPSQNKFDLTDITKLLFNHDAPAKPAAAPGRSQLSHLASLGAPTASAEKMSPSFWAGLDGLLEDQYRSCWSYLGLTAGVKYIPQVRVVYGVDGSLQGQPVLLNPPSDPSMQSLADSALRAVRRCNPLKIPEQYAPYYDQWKGRVLRFDPEEMAG